MTNIIYNELTMHSGEKPLDSFFAQHPSGACLDFEFIEPIIDKSVSARREKWGTGWNAMNMERIAENVIKFETGWISPIKVFKQLAKINNSHLTVLYCHEVGEFSGRVEVSPDSFEQIDMSNSLQGDELLFHFQPSLRDLHILVDGRYRWAE